MSKCYWITGLSASGKTTLSTLLTDHFRHSGRKVILFDGDELRRVLADEAYTREERIALGMRDIGGTGLFSSEYLVASKKFGRLDTTLGIGWGVLGKDSNISNFTI